MKKIRRAVRITLLVLVVGFVLGESLAAIRYATIRLLLDRYPATGFDEDGRLGQFEVVHREDGRVDRTRLGPERESVATETLPTWRVSGSARIRLPSRPWVLPAHVSKTAPRGARSDADLWFGSGMFLNALSHTSGRIRRDGLTWTGQHHSERGWRFFARDGDRIVGGLGPDGWTPGEAAWEGPHFDPTTTLLRREGIGYALLTAGRSRVLILTLSRSGPSPVIVSEPVPVPPGAGPIEALPTARGWILLLGRKIVAVDANGKVFGRAAWNPAEERVLTRAWLESRQALCLATDVAPFPTTGGTIRYRLFARSGAESLTIEETVLRPISLPERLLAGAVALPALLRPLPLNVASALSAAPGEREAVTRWWWREPHLAGGANPGWLGASALLSLVCAVIAARSARVRCESRRAAWAWAATAFLLGPLGLLAFRIAVPWTAVREVGSGRRAVNLDRCPATDAPWPEPTRDGTDLLVGPPGV